MNGHAGEADAAPPPGMRERVGRGPAGRGVMAISVVVSGGSETVGASPVWAVAIPAVPAIFPVWPVAIPAIPAISPVWAITITISPIWAIAIEAITVGAPIIGTIAVGVCSPISGVAICAPRIPAVTVVRNSEPKCETGAAS